MKTPNESILASLLEQKNVVLAKISVYGNYKWEVPDNLTKRLAELNAALEIHLGMMAEDERRAKE